MVVVKLYCFLWPGKAMQLSKVKLPIETRPTHVFEKHDIKKTPVYCNDWMIFNGAFITDVSMK